MREMTSKFRSANRFFGRARVLVLLAAQAAGPAVVVGGEAPELGAGPVAVSPAAVAGVAVVESRCPTFIWGVVHGAERYELLVYEAIAGGGHEARGEAEAVLSKEFPGSVHGWVPASGDCLDGGGRYAWTVRAVFPESVSEWADPSVFEISPELSAAEARSLLQALQGVARRESEPKGPFSQVGSDSPRRFSEAPVRRMASDATAMLAPGAAVQSASSELWVTVPSHAFQRFAGVDVVNGGERYCDDNDCGWQAPLDIPHGARIIGIELAGCDYSAENDVELTLFEAPFGASLVPLESVSTGVAALPNCVYKLGGLTTPHIADQFLKSYLVRVGIGLNSLPCGFPPFFRTCPNSLLSFSAVRVYYEGLEDGVVEPTAATPYSLFP